MPPTLIPNYGKSCFASHAVWLRRDKRHLRKRKLPMNNWFFKTATYDERYLIYDLIPQNSLALMLAPVDAGIAVVAIDLMLHVARAGRGWGGLFEKAVLSWEGLAHDRRYIDPEGGLIVELLMVGQANRRNWLMMEMPNFFL
jgi:hypothetical protein